MASLLIKKRNTQMAERNCENMVAKAAPFTPICSRKMKIGSKIILVMAPTKIVIIPMRPKPWELIKLFIPKLIITKTLPNR